MESSRLKVKRANRHIDEIIADQAALPKSLYDLRILHRSVAPVAVPDGDFLVYTPKHSISKHFGAIVGDAVNNLRESMDVWINTAIRCVGPKTRLYFPFSEERKNLETSKSFILIKKIFPDAADFIAKKIEPCRDTNLYLWAATSLCKDNKHNDFIPVVGVSQINAEHIAIGTNSLNNISVGGNADKSIKAIRAPYKSIIVEGDLRLSVEVSFPKGAIFEDQSVVPTLLHMSEVVSQTLNALEGFIRPYCK
ncbi:MAG: hypothetical protein Q8Q26_16695 [Pseudorhodobacter sp.]|nr:hypothetical protein [Pseudorhodobacter sp.]